MARPGTREPSADAVAANRAVRWTRWTGETEEAFRARVLADAARMGTTAHFTADKRGRNEPDAERPEPIRFGRWRELA